MHVLQVLPLLAGLAAAATPATVKIAEYSFAGSGCAAGSRAASSVADPATLVVPLTILKAQSGNSSKVVENRVNCQTLIKITHDAGWQFSVSKADYYGRVKLGPGAEAISKSTYYFAGNTKEIAKQYYFDGPFDGLYFRNDRWVGTTDRLWSPCGSEGSLNINSEVRVAPIGSGSSKPASMELYNFLGGKIGLDWQKCTK